MDLRQLEYFVAVADELSFTRAAARRHVAQSALSYQIARLERETGVLLFDRTSRSVRLTAAGEVLLPRARGILGDLADAGAELAELSGLVTGRLRIGMIGSTGIALPAVERTLAEFHRRHPGVEIAIGDTGSGRMAEQVRDGALDLAFVGLFRQQVPDDVVHHTLHVEPLVAISRAGGGPGPRGAGRRVGLAELADGGPLIEMRPESGVRRQVDAAFERAGVQRRVAFELSTSDAVIRFVGLGFGAAIVPASAAAGHGAVTVQSLADRAARHPIGLVHRRPQPAAPAARRFLAMVVEAVGAPPRGSRASGGSPPTARR